MQSAKEAMESALWKIKHYLNEALDESNAKLRSRAKAVIGLATDALDKLEAEREESQRESDEYERPVDDAPKNPRLLRDERNAFLYDAYCKGEKFDDMLEQVAKHPCWPQLASRAAALNAAKRYAKRKRKPWPKRKGWTSRSNYAAIQKTYPRRKKRC